MAMIQYDYESIKNKLIYNLESKLNGKILSNSTAMHLIEIFAEEFAEIVMYNEYLTRESKWSVAQNTSSILTQLELFGYKPHRKKGASGVVLVSANENFNTAHPYNIVIPKFTKFSNGSLTYCSSEEVILSNTDPFVIVPVVQGEYKTTGEFLGNSFSGDVYTIENNSVENNLYELRNNNIVCKEVDYFGQSQITVNGSEPETYTYNNFEYRIKNIEDFSGIQIEFAPNSHDANDHFEFKYLVTEGELGSSFDLYPNGIIQVTSSVTDSQGSIVKLYVKQTLDTGAISGGTNYESINDMRNNAPYTFNRVDKIITKNDYLAAIKSLMSDCIFQIWTEASLKYDNEITEMEDATDFINNCKVFFSGIKYDIQRQSVENVESFNIYDTLISKLIDKKAITDYFIFNDSDIFKFYINGKVYYDRHKISDSYVKNQIVDAVHNYYSVNKAEFKKDIYRSNYTSIFNGIDGINHVDVNAVMYTEIPFALSNGVSVVTNGGNSRKNFSFSLANTSEVEISNQFIFTSVDPSKQSSQLVKDLFILKYVEEDGGWNFYSTDGERLSTNDDNATIRWLSHDGDLEIDGILNSFEINITTPRGREIYYGNSDGTSTGEGLDVNLMICRFVPENFNCKLCAHNQIIVYTDATSDTVSGIINPWRDEGSHNWWYSPKEQALKDLDKYGSGLVFIAE